MPKPKYAIVMTADEDYLPGVNGQLNACRYYGMEDDGVEFHLIHSFRDDHPYLKRAHKIFPNLVSIKLDDFMIESGRWKKPMKKKGKPEMKYPRWWYPAERLADYDAICVLDADRQIVNNFTHYFNMIARSDMIGLAKNDWSDAEWFSQDDSRAMAANPAIYSNPYFITGKRAAKLFPLIPEYAEHPNKYYPSYKGRNAITGDMHPVNLTLLQTGMINDLIPLPATQWVFVNTDHVKLTRREVAGRHYIGLHGKGDLLNSFHRKFWGQKICQRHMRGHDAIGSSFAMNNTRIFWEFTKFFNTELYLKIDWEYGDFPSQLLSVLSGKWLWENVKIGLRNMEYPVPSQEIVDELDRVIEYERGKYKFSEEAINLLAQASVPVIAALNKQWIK